MATIPALTENTAINSIAVSKCSRAEMRQKRPKTCTIGHKIITSTSPGVSHKRDIVAIVTLMVGTNLFGLYVSHMFIITIIKYIIFVYFI